jgi:hypothetical protein
LSDLLIFLFGLAWGESDFLGEGFLNHDLKVQVHIVSLMSLVVDCLPIDLKIPEGPTGRQRDHLNDLSGLIILNFETIGITMRVIFIDSHSKGF